MEEQLPGIILKLSSSELQQEVEFDVLLTYDILGKPARASAHPSECLHPLPTPLSLCLSLSHVICELIVGRM